MKSFLIKLSYTVFPLWFILITLTFYLAYYVTPRISGDIGNLACIPFGHEYNKILEKGMEKETFFPTVYDTKKLDSIHVDVLTIGDSFSQQGNGGYQNYLCKKGLNVANCYRHLYGSPVQYAFNLLQNDIIDSTNTHIMIVESVERDFEGLVRGFERNNNEIPHIPQSEESSGGYSLLRTRDYILYKIGYETPIYHAILDRDLFSSESPRELYFYHADIDTDVSLTKADQLKQVYNLLLNKAREKGIILILLIAVDKYDLYQDCIVSNKFPMKTVNEDIRRILGESPNIVLSKFYLKPLVERGEKDVFLFNDTHWSYKAAKVVADELYKRIERFKEPI